MKTGGWGGEWIALDRPKPPPVPDRYAYWTDEPPEVSSRCSWWLRQIGRGWRPNTHLRRLGYDEMADWYGVYIWECLHLILPRLAACRTPRL